MQEAIKLTLETLKNGRTAIIPTDTGWAIACDAINNDAIESMMKISNTTDVSTIVVLTDSVGRLQSYVEEMADIVWDLFELSEKPLTIRLPNIRNLAPILQQQDSYCAFRVTKGDFSKQLCSRFRRPVATISIDNISPDMNTGIGQKVDFKVASGVFSFQEESVIQLGKGNLVQIIKE